jgi:hypothetical protein
MKIQIALLWTLLSVGINRVSIAQQIHYTTQETFAIHDSIQKSRWDIGGSLSKYSFRYMSEFFPVGVINKALQTYEFRSNPKKSIEISMSIQRSETLSLEQYLNKRHISSFIVVHKGSVVYEKYFSMLPEDQHTLQSITKVITSLLITNLINEKKINIDHSIDKYITRIKRF